MSRARLFIKLELQYFAGALFGGAIGYLAYGVDAGLYFFGLFFVLMQPLLINEYFKKR